MTSSQERFSKAVWVAGSLNWDFITREKTLVPRGRHVHHQRGDWIRQAGGHGANQAQAVYRASHSSPPAPAISSLSSRRLSRSSSTPDNAWQLPFDVEVYMQGMIGAIGDYGTKIKIALQTSNINTDKIYVEADVETGHAYIVVEPDGVPVITSFAEANDAFTPDKVEAFSPVPDLVLVQMEIPLDTVRRLIKQAKDQKVPVIFNAAPYHWPVHGDIDNDKELFDVDHLILNADQADRILHLTEMNEQERQNPNRRREQENRYRDACDKFHHLGANCVVITMGNLGFVASYLEPRDANGNSNPRYYMSGGKQGLGEIIDQTGASDAFIGAYAIEILHSLYLRHEVLDIDAALNAGIKAGGIGITREGSFESMPWRDEIFAPEESFISAAPFNRNVPSDC